MKKILLAAALCVSLTGCESFLEEELRESVSPENVYTSTHGFEVGVTGLYNYARWEFQTWNEGPAPHGAVPYETFQAGTDIVHRGHTEGTLKPFEDYTIASNTSYVRSFWRWGYAMVGACNLLIEHLDDPDVAWDKPTDRIGFEAEARFFRAYAYRYLVYLYGDVPWVERIQRDFRVDFTRTPKAEVLGHMIDDLKFAEENLPEDPDQMKEGRLTKWPAKHMLAEVYLMAEKYEEAAAKAQEVIDAPYYALTTERYGVNKDQPGDCFSDMFLEGNQNRNAGNKESLWNIQLEYNEDGGGEGYADWTKRAWVPKYWDVPGFILADSLGGRGLAQIVAFPHVFKWYDEGDMRNSKYNVHHDWYYNNPEHEKFGQKYEATEEQWELHRKAGQLCEYPTKFNFSRNATDPGYGGNNKDRMKFRLAETYLLRAEAEIRLGNKPEAAKMINVVRARANAKPVDASEVDMDYLLDERVRELLGEELRRITLMRTGKLVERTQKWNPISGKLIKDHHVLYPIPQEVIDANTGAEFPQNPGY